ncbi:MAG TPA: hypothetical protein VHS57_08870 [Acidimicrobiales bacterium]|nr:hypothetical protein [Acidimicrobiales bacterium]
MHAVIVDVEINEPEAARKGLEEQVLPMVKSAPGFVAGYWVSLGDTDGTSIVVFQTKEQALAGAPEEGSTSQGVTFTRVVDGEVLASA